MTDDQNDSIFFISSDGANSKVKINTPPGVLVITNATKTHMQNVVEKSSGGKISHNAAHLTQISGSQIAKNQGRIINRVEGGTLYQENLTQSAEDKGEILNEVKKKLKIPLILVIIGVGADVISYYFLGVHLLEIFAK